MCWNFIHMQWDWWHAVTTKRINFPMESIKTMFIHERKINFRVSSGPGKVRESPYQAKVRELSGNFVMSQGKLKMLGKVRKFCTGHGYGGFMSNLKHFGQHPHSLLMELLASVTDKMSCATQTVIWYATGFELTRDTSYLALMGKLWSAFYENFEENSHVMMGLCCMMSLLNDFLQGNSAFFCGTKSVIFCVAKLSWLPFLITVCSN